MIKKIFQQFMKPEGMLGKVAGSLMAITGTKKNRWTIALLDLQADDNIFEIGFGPGTAIGLMAKQLKTGKVVGIDYSEVMLKQAEKRNREAIEKGKVQLHLAEVDNLPNFNILFDKVISVNSIIFWEDPISALKNIRKLMKRGALIALTVQPYNQTATAETVRATGNDIKQYLQVAGFVNVHTEIKQIKPSFAVCILGENNIEGEGR